MTGAYFEAVEVDFPAGRRLRVLKHRAGAQKHGHAQHEREFLESLLGELEPGAVVYDIGAESGEFGALVAGVVGPRNVHLFEPAPWAWPGISATWLANGLGSPGGAFAGFVADDSTLAGIRLARADAPTWPAESAGPIREDIAFVVVHERPEIPMVTIDRWCATRDSAPPGGVPNVLMIDVEGAEELVLRGAEQVLRGTRVRDSGIDLGVSRPVVYVSVHPNDWISRFTRATGEPCSRASLFAFMRQLGYHGDLVSVDHEEHWRFER